MTQEEEIEIRMRYREARNKGEQIKILSQMFLATEAEICRALGIRSKKEDREQKRQEAMELLKSGVSRMEIARRLNISDGSVRRWEKDTKEREKNDQQSHPDGAADS